MATYAKKFSQMVIYKNVPSTHLMNKQIFFQNV